MLGMVMNKKENILCEQGKHISFEINDAVARITLDRPEKSNAYSGEMLDLLESTIDVILHDEEINVLVLDSSSKNFCAGADLNEINHRTSNDILNLKSRRIFEKLYHAPIVSIAAVTGCAVAGGFELALACDFIIASDNSRFWLPEVEIGLIPAAGGINRLVQQAGPMLAKEVIICGRKLDANEGYKYGLVTKVVKEDELGNEAFNLARKISNRPSSAVKIAKISINEAVLSQKSSLDLFGQVFLNELRNKKKIS